MVSASSCDDFLTELPENAYTIENSVTDYKSAVNSVNGIYGVYTKSTNLGGQLYASLHCMAGLWDYNTVMVNMGYTQTNSSSVSSYWSDLYKVVNAATEKPVFFPRPVASEAMPTFICCGCSDAGSTKRTLRTESYTVTRLPNSAI